MPALSLNAADADRLCYLDESDPFYPDAAFPKLITPQWVGEPGVEAVVVLAIDDMTRSDKWEMFLRPIIERLKRIDGRAPVSIMTVRPDPLDPQLQTWLREGLSLETHTLTHPCPCLAKGDFQFASSNYHSCVELMNRITGNKAVAFRMPCCDSMNSPSPRFYAEIFNQTNSAGQFLTIDSSVMNLTTTNDGALPREMIMQADGRERFRKYVPFPFFATTIENYPYPYVIGKLCWEFPGAIPSDWEAQHVHGTNNPATVVDWKVALDVTVLKQGTLSLIFHPHGWIRPDQIIELIDYAVARYGNRVKFLNFREAQEQLNHHLLADHPLRAGNGQDNGVRLLDLNGDGFVDVVLANERRLETRVWNPAQKLWKTAPFPTSITVASGSGQRFQTGLRFGIVRAHKVSAFVLNEKVRKAWTFDGDRWIEDEPLLKGLEDDGQPIYSVRDKGDGLTEQGVRFRDIDGDGQSELLVANPAQSTILSWSEREKTWKPMRYTLPEGVIFVDSSGRDAGVRFVDVNGDGFADVLFSNEKRFSFHLFIPEPYLGFRVGWSREVLSGQRGDFGEIPMITRTGSNNGAWVHGRQLFFQNEDTANLPDKVDRRSFERLLGGLQPPPLSPEDSLRSIHVKEGFEVKLAAWEPLVQDPIAFEWGPDGKFWVVEMGDYPLGVDGKGKAGGTVKFLEDTNHDGIYDKATVFLENLNFPTGIIPWKNGVIVCAVPEIFYAEDTDGDGKADRRQVLFTGFNPGNQQHRANGFDYGLDNWVYGANGDSGGRVRSGTGQSVNISGHDFRFRPGSGEFEAQAGNAQYGRHRDDWGNWFGNNNSAWLWHYFVPEHYLARNPQLPIRSTKRMLAQYADHARVYPRSRPMQRFNDIGMAGHVTAACSAVPYRDDLFGAEFATSVFICEPVYNVVHREILEPAGVSFSSHRAEDEQQSEFVASTDNWFRPVMAKTGPDGALYIADMYRLVIEHPEWIPGDVKAQLDLRAGHDKGRIYKVFPRGAVLRGIPRLDQLDLAGLVAALESPNGWQRDTAQRLIAERADPQTIKLLSALFHKSERPKTRVQVLGALEALGGIDPELLMTGLRDAHPAVREHSVRLCEPFLRNRNDAAVAQLVEGLLRLKEDADLRVRYQLAFTLGECGDPRAGEVLVRLALEEEANGDLLKAVLSSAPRHAAEMLSASFNAPPERAARLVDELLGLAVTLSDGHSLAEALRRMAPPKNRTPAAWQFTGLAALLESLERRDESLDKLYRQAGNELRESIEQVEILFNEARARARKQIATGEEQPDLGATLGILGRGRGQHEQDWELLGGLIGPRFAMSLQEAALTALRRAENRRAGEILISKWPESSPAFRLQLIETLLSRPDWLTQFLESIELGKIPAAQLNPAAQQRFLKNSSQAIRDRAAKLFGAMQANRQNIVDSYKAIAQLKGEFGHGEVLFKQTCAMCHEPQNGRPQVGPDLGALADKTLDTLLVAIFDPNRAVESRYVNYTAMTRDQREFSGVLVTETANSISLRSPSAEETILRRDLARLESSGLSLMPEGFEKILSLQDAADLIAYLTRRQPLSR